MLLTLHQITCALFATQQASKLYEVPGCLVASGYQASVFLVVDMLVIRQIAPSKHRPLDS